MCGATSRARAAMLLGLLAVTGACYRSSAPRGWLGTPVEAQRDAFGSWISVAAQPATAPVAQGELIAIDADTVHVMATGRLVSLPRTTLCCAVLTAYRMDLSELQVWWALGTLSTVSHGLVLILSAPAWLLTGASATAGASYAPRIRSLDPVVLQPFARFPQGIPAGLDRTTIRAKY